jgi:hypothetical protein
VSFIPSVSYAINISGHLHERPQKKLQETLGLTDILRYLLKLLLRFKNPTILAIAFEVKDI